MTDPKIIVTQEDIDRAEEWRRSWRHCLGERTALYEAFARHRIASTSNPQVGEVERVCMECGATVASHNAGMACHCKFIPWSVRAALSDDQSKYGKGSAGPDGGEG